MKDPAVLFYTSDFLTGTFNLTNEQVGKYIRLICFQHQHGRIPPDDFERMTDGDPKIAKKFHIDEEGNYYNKRLEIEIIKRSKFVESRRRNLLGNKKKHMEQHMSAHMEAHMDAHMENENENENDISIEDFKKFFIENGYMEEAGEKAWHYYNDNGWKDKNDTPVKNWKNKCRNNWFKPENKKTGPKLAI